MSEILLSSSARSVSVRNSRSLNRAGRCNGSLVVLVQIPCRSGSPHAVAGEAPATGVRASTGARANLRSRATKSSTAATTSVWNNLLLIVNLLKTFSTRASESADVAPTRGSLDRLGLLIQFVRRPCPRGAHEELLPIFERDVPSIGSPRPVFCLIPVDDDDGARKKRLPGEAAPEEYVRRTRFERPVLGLSLWRLDVHVQPDVGVDPLHSRDGTLELHRLVRVELGRERVMRSERRARDR